jgi:DNA-binding NtrC family response regulator
MPGTPHTGGGAAQGNRGPVGGFLDPVVTRQGRQIVPSGGDGDGGVGSDTPIDVANPAERGAATNWVLGRNVPMRRLARIVERAAEVECTVLFRGERGTGKELLARLLHRSGPRAARPFVAVDCAGLPEEGAGRILFGDDAAGDDGEVSAPGLLRQADGGMLFLDEVDALPRSVQPRLLAVLESRELMPRGGRRAVPIDVQVSASTSRDLDVVIEAGAFHRRLYDRLNMLELRVPPLRERIEDLPEFIDFLSRRIAGERGLPVWKPSAEVVAELARLPWPGNVRQLEEAVARFYLLDIAETAPRAPADAAGRQAIAAALSAMRDRRRGPAAGQDILSDRVAQLLAAPRGRE